MLVDDFMQSLKRNGVPDNELIYNKDDDMVSLMFRMPYKGAAITTWLYESADEVAIRTTATRSKGQETPKVLVALNEKNSEYPSYNYFIDPQYPKEIGMGRIVRPKDASEVYIEVFSSADDVLKELKDFIEINEV